MLFDIQLIILKTIPTLGRHYFKSLKIYFFILFPFLSLIILNTIFKYVMSSMKGL